MYLDVIIDDKKLKNQFTRNDAQMKMKIQDFLNTEVSKELLDSGGGIVTGIYSTHNDNDNSNSYHVIIESGYCDYKDDIIDAIGTLYSSDSHCQKNEINIIQNHFDVENSEEII